MGFFFLLSPFPSHQKRFSLEWALPIFAETAYCFVFGCCSTLYRITLSATPHPPHVTHIRKDTETIPEGINYRYVRVECVSADRSSQYKIKKNDCSHRFDSSVTKTHCNCLLLTIKRYLIFFSLSFTIITLLMGNEVPLFFCYKQRRHLLCRTCLAAITTSSVPAVWRSATLLRSLACSMSHKLEEEKGRDDVWIVNFVNDEL